MSQSQTVAKSESLSQATKKEVGEEEIKTKMVNFYKSFIIKNDDEEEAYSDEEDKKPGQPVDHKEETFKEVQSLDGTVTKFSSGAPHTTTVSDALLALLTGVADEAPDQLEEILP